MRDMLPKSNICMKDMTLFICKQIDATRGGELNFGNSEEQDKEKK